ncbi:MAG: S1 RNA-binding domain-containing protein [Lachnospiraceae bacterium]|nr:S1 RNA-binding domain-containing protein [Lachnospiraceae bacterium]
MLKLGQRQCLTVIERKEFGVYLSDEEKKEKVLLPKKQVDAGTAIGDKIDVFLYKDSEDRIIATCTEPKVTKGKVALLEVKDVSKIGAFLDWGLEKDLFLPYKEQTQKVSKGDRVLVALYIDKSDRLCATMKVYPYLETKSEYKKDDHVSGTIYEINKDFGAYVAVDNRFSALIPKKDMPNGLKVGDHIEGRVTGLKKDGKIDISVREKAYIQMSIDADKIMKYLEDHDGVIPFNDKASPQLISEVMNMSKNEFKRAVGNLLKAGLIRIETDSIRRI